MVQERYGVRLSTEEKGRLRQMIRAGRSSAQAIIRARILLKTGRGLERISSGRSLGRFGADRVPRQAAVRRGGTG